MYSSRLQAAIARVASIARAEAALVIYWYRENRTMTLLQIAWPYMMVFIVIGLGSAYGSIERFAEALNVADPLLYVVASSLVAFTSIGIIESATQVALWHRWLGTLPYVMLAPNSMMLYVMTSGVVQSLVISAIIMIGLTPGALILSGPRGVAGLFVVLVFLLLGMLPLVAIAGAAAAVSLAVREESNVLSFLNPFLLIVSGIFYPIEMLPRILESVSDAVPVRYVVEAARIMAATGTPAGKAILALAWALAVLSVVYNALGAPAVHLGERVVRRRGVD